MRSLPFAYKNLLEPWFKPESLEKGWELISSGLIAQLFFRNFSGGIFAGKTANGRATVRFASAPWIRQKFKIDTPCCSCCSERQPIGNFCCHVAALALAFLREEDEESGTFPLPLLFSESLWVDIAVHLHNEFDSSDRRQLMAIEFEPEESRITVRRHNARMKMEIDPLTAGLLRDRFPRLPAASSGTNWPQAPAGLAKLADELFRLSLNKQERELFSRGCKTLGLDQEDSAWFWLARQFYLATGQHSFTVEQEKNGAGFRIVTAGNAGRLFSLSPGRNSSGCRLLKSINDKGCGAVPFLPPARAFWRTYLKNDSAAICCQRMLRLDSGEVYSREELAPRQWGLHYHLPDRGFLPVQPVPAGADLRPAGSSAQLSLFGNDGVGQKVQEWGFDVSGSDFARFIEENGDALADSRNQTDPELLTFKPVEKPDRLHLDLQQSDEDWCYLAAYYGIGNREIDLVEVLQASMEGREYLPGSKWLKLKDTSLSWLHNAGSERLWQDKKGKTGLKLHRREILTLASLLDCTINGAGCGGQDQPLTLPATDKWRALQETAAPAHLREYQKKGVAWLAHLLANGLGGILADVEIGDVGSK